MAVWAEAVWRVAPPPEFARSCECLRQIPGRIVGELGKYRDACIAGAEGRASGTVRIDIDLQPLIDGASAAGEAGVRCFGHPAATGRGNVIGITLAVVLVVLLWGSCASF